MRWRGRLEGRFGLGSWRLCREVCFVEYMMNMVWDGTGKLGILGYTLCLG